jgi:hypothetical protein
VFILEGKKVYTLAETAEKTGIPVSSIRTRIRKNQFDSYRDGDGGLYLTEKGYKACIAYSNQIKRDIEEAKPKKSTGKEISKFSGKCKPDKKPKRILLDINTSEYGPYIRFRTEDERYFHALLKRGADNEGVSLASYLAKLLANQIQ